MGASGKSLRVRVGLFGLWVIGLRFMEQRESGRSKEGRRPVRHLDYDKQVSTVRVRGCVGEAVITRTHRRLLGREEQVRTRRGGKEGGARFLTQAHWEGMDIWGWNCQKATSDMLNDKIGRHLDKSIVCLQGMARAYKASQAESVADQDA